LYVAYDDVVVRPHEWNIFENDEKKNIKRKPRKNVRANEEHRCDDDDTTAPAPTTDRRC